jgi:hypothetical protein
MPRQPPKRTRKVGITIFEPEVRALMTPARIRPTIVKATIEKETLPRVGAKIAKNGTEPPSANAVADAIEA